MEQVSAPQTCCKRRRQSARHLRQVKVRRRAIRIRSNCRTNDTMSYAPFLVPAREAGASDIRLYQSAAESAGPRPSSVKLTSKMREGKCLALTRRVRAPCCSCGSKGLADSGNCLAALFCHKTVTARDGTQGLRISGFCRQTLRGGDSSTPRLGITAQRTRGGDSKSRHGPMSSHLCN